MFEQAAIAVQDEKGYAKLHSLFDQAFDVRDVEVLLNKVKRARLRIRDFAAVLERGFLGKEAPALYEGAAGFGSGADAREVSAAGGRGAAGAAAAVFEGVRLLLRRMDFGLDASDAGLKQMKRTREGLKSHGEGEI